jgi:hypothetical protein
LQRRRRRGLQIFECREAAALFPSPKILKGTNPADLPIEQPSKFTFIVNLKAAKELSVTVPSQLLALADQLIELVAVGDPVGTGLVPSLARPGGNLTGLSSIDKIGLERRSGIAHKANAGNFRLCVRRKRPSCRRAGKASKEATSPHGRALRPRITPYHTVGLQDRLVNVRFTFSWRRRTTSFRCKTETRCRHRIGIA